MGAKIRIYNIVYLRKPVKDYQKPFRFNLTIRWQGPDGKEHGGDVIGCLGGVGRDGVASWNGPIYWIGRKVAFSFIVAPGTYEVVLAALAKGGYFKSPITDLFGPNPELANRPIPAEDEVGLPGEIEIEN